MLNLIDFCYNISNTNNNSTTELENINNTTINISLLELNNKTDLNTTTLVEYKAFNVESNSKIIVFSILFYLITIIGISYLKVISFEDPGILIQKVIIFLYDYFLLYFRNLTFIICLNSISK